MLNKFKFCLRLGSLLVGCLSPWRSPRPPARGPFDAKAREIFEKVISIPTSLGNRKVPEMAEYLAGEFRAAGFPAEDVTIVPFKLPDDETAALVVRYRGDGSGGKPILLLAHMDVVTAKTAGLGARSVTSSSKRTAFSTAAAPMT